MSSVLCGGLLECDGAEVSYRVVYTFSMRQWKMSSLVVLDGGSHPPLLAVVAAAAPMWYLTMHDDVSWCLQTAMFLSCVSTYMSSVLCDGHSECDDARCRLLSATDS
jgi:hypothetical protein